MADSTTPESQTPATSQTPQPILEPHNNTVVPHAIADYDTDLVQLNVWTGTKWVNIFDGNDFTNAQADLHRVAKVVEAHTSEIQDATKTASDAVKAVDSAVSVSKVNSDAIAAQGEAISEAKNALDSVATEIQLTASNAASDAASIRADVAKVESEVASAKSASQNSVNALQSDIDAAKKDLADAHSGLLNAQAAIDQNKKLINDSVAKINNDIAQNRNDLAAAQQANADTAKKLDSYTKQAIEQGKTIEELQTDDNSTKLTIADIKGNVSQVQNSVTGLTASLKDANDNLTTVKALADSLSSTLTDHGKNIASLQATTKELSSTLGDADGRLSKVEQTAKEQSTTLSTVQGDLSQVKQTADGLTDTLKDAQGDITKVQTTVKGLSEQITNAQGSITSLQTDVTGIKATITNHENDIHTLQADAKSLTDDMTDAQGNISSLQKTSTDLTSEMQDHDGRLSKVEQTANGTQQTVADQQGQINTIKTDADGIHQTLTGQGNQIATINTTLDGLNAKYEGVSGDLGKLKNQAQWVTITSAVDLNSIKTPCHEFLKGAATNAPNELAWWYLTVESSDDSSQVTQTVIADQSNNRYTRRWNGEWSAWVKDATQTDITALSNCITTNSTQITQNKQAIALKADQSTVDNLSGKVSWNTAQLKVQADQISSKVSSEDFNTLDNKVGSAIAQIDKNTTAIDQNSKQISLKADQTEVDSVKNTATNNSSRLDVMANEIQSKVTSTDVNNIVDGKGFITQQVAQSLIDQKADTITESITGLSQKVDNNNQATVDKIQQITASIDGVQSIVKDKANQSQVTQLANALQIKMTGATIASASDVTLTYTGKENEYPPAAPLAGMNDVDKGSTLILSFDYVASDDTKLTPQLDGTPWIPWGTLANATDVKKGEKGSYSKTITVNDDSWQKGNAKNLCIRCDGFKGTIEITNLVLKYADTVHDVQSTFDMLRDDINLRVTKGDLLSQINIAAGHTLIQSDKIYLDADSVVFGENSTAFIPSAYITDINADKITTGILKSIAINNGDGAFTVNPSGDVVANSIKVRNGNFYQGDIFGANIYAIMRDKDQRAFSSLDDVDETQDNWFKINGDILEWHRTPDEYASIGPSLSYVKDNHSPDDHDYTGTTLGLTIVGTKGITLSTGDQAKWAEDNPTVGTYKDPIKNIQNLSWANETRLEIGQDHIQVNLGNGGDISNGSYFSIQKDNYLTFAVGAGDKKDEFQSTTTGRQGFHSLNAGAIYFDREDHGNTHDSLNYLAVFGTLNVTQGQKNSLVKTSQGWTAVHAYETAEYYFGDIGENNTGANGKVIVGLDQLFAQTVNTDMQYQVFITPYSDAHVWVSQRLNNYFVVESDQPNAEFGWEIKARRKGYEHSRLTNFSQSMK